MITPAMNTAQIRNRTAAASVRPGLHGKEVVQQAVALRSQERLQIPGVSREPLFVEIEVLVRPCASGLGQPLDHAGCELQMEQDPIGVLESESLVSGRCRGRQQRGAVRQIERITVPLQDADLRRESLEEGICRSFRGQAHAVEADLLHGLSVFLIGIDPRSEGMRDELAAKADPQCRNPSYGGPDEPDLVVPGREVFVDAHRSAHDDERGVLGEIRDGIRLPETNDVEREPVILQVVGDAALALVRDVLQDQRRLIREMAPAWRETLSSWPAAAGCAPRRRLSATGRASWTWPPRARDSRSRLPPGNASRSLRS